MTLTTPNPYLPVEEAQTLCEVLDSTRVSTQALYAIDRVTPAQYTAVLLRRMIDVFAVGEGHSYFAGAYGVAWEAARVVHGWAEHRRVEVDPRELAALTGDGTSLTGINHAYQTAAIQGRLDDADRLLQQIVYHPDVLHATELRRRETTERAFRGQPAAWDEAREAVDAVGEAVLHLMRSMLAIERASQEQGL